MIPYKLDYTIEKVSKTFSSNEQKALQQLTGKSLTQKEAQQIWSKVKDHKWYVSERLGRDVGFRVAAIDFFENIYQSGISNGKTIPNSLHQTSQPNILPA